MIICMIVCFLLFWINSHYAVYSVDRAKPVVFVCIWFSNSKIQRNVAQFRARTCWWHRNPCSFTLQPQMATVKGQIPEEQQQKQWRAVSDETSTHIQQMKVRNQKEISKCCLCALVLHIFQYFRNILNVHSSGCQFLSDSAGSC